MSAILLCFKGCKCASGSSNKMAIELTSNLSTDLALISDSNGKISTSTVTSTQLGYLSNVTSDVQNQLSEKQTKTLITPLTIAGVQQTTVEDALNALNERTTGAYVKNHKLFI